MHTEQRHSFLSGAVLFCSALTTDSNDFMLLSKKLNEARGTHREFFTKQ